MKKKVITRFNHARALVFDYLVYTKDFQAWNPDKSIKWINHYFDREDYTGFDTVCEIEAKKATISAEVIFFEDQREVRYMTTQAVFDNGDELASMPTFPYDQMAQRIEFSDLEGGCEVEYEIYLQPRSWWGWILCKFFVLPATVSCVKRSNHALMQYLAER